MSLEERLTEDSGPWDTNKVLIPPKMAFLLFS
jgi:hypothetical protein